MSTSVPTAASAHEVLVGIGILVLFVVTGVYVAGISNEAGSIVLWLFLAFLVLQLLTHGQAFIGFLTKYAAVTSPQSLGGSTQ